MAWGRGPDTREVRAPSFPTWWTHGRDSVIAAAEPQAGLVARALLPGEFQQFRPPVIGEADAPTFVDVGQQQQRAAR